MASRDRSMERHDGSSPPSPSVSETNSNALKPSSIKDRKCPFCDQSFTSSSLGRHLDTFIRPRNPKPPDGIHNVHEIRKIRSAITRRHARVSAAKEEPQRQQQPQSPAHVQRHLPGGPTTSQVYPPPTMQPPVPQAAPMEYLPSRRLPPQPQPVPNKAHWTATGVINDLPARASATPSHRELPPLPHSYRRESVIQDHEERRTAHATEMAFKEVLRLIHDAAERAKRPPLFDFDFFAMSFPALCLRLLHISPGLCSAESPPDTWPLGPPKEDQYHDLRGVLSEKLLRRNTEPRQCQHTNQHPDADADADADSDHQMNGDHTSPPQHQDPSDDEYHAHLTKSYNHWTTLSPTSKSQTHHLATTLAYAEEATRRKTTSHALDSAQAEVKQLKMQLANTHTAGLPYLSQSIIRTLLDSTDISAWNLDDLVTRFRYAPPSASASAGPSTTTRAGTSPHDHHQHDNTRAYSISGDRARAAAHSREQYLGNNTWHVSGYAPSAPTPGSVSASADMEATSPTTTAAGMTPRTNESDRYTDESGQRMALPKYAYTARPPAPGAQTSTRGVGTAEGRESHGYAHASDWGLADGIPRVDRDRIYRNRGSLPDAQLAYGAVPGEVEMGGIGGTGGTGGPSGVDDGGGGRGGIDDGGGRGGIDGSGRGVDGGRRGSEWMRGVERGQRRDEGTGVGGASDGDG